MPPPTPEPTSWWWRALGSLTELGGGVAFVVLATRWSGHEPVGVPRLALAFVVAAVIIVAVHEGAHALVGRLLGFRVFRVVLGSGPRWARFPVGATTVELRGLPISGITQLATDDPHRLRARFGVAVLAGPLVPLGVVLAALLTWPAGSGGVWLAGLVALGVTSTVASLIPRQVDRLASDGLLLVRTAQRDHATLTMLRHAHGVLELDRAVEAGDLAGVEALATGGDPVAATLAAVDLRRWDEAVASARTALLGDLSEDLRATLRNALAFSLAHRAGDGDLTEADVITTALLAEWPDLVGLPDTRGLVLLRLGRPAEAVTQLERSATDEALPLRARAQVLARLAVARYGAGDPHTGRRDLAKAIAVDAADTEVAAAIRAVAAAELEVVRRFWDQLDGDAASRAAELRAALGRSAPATAAVLAHLATTGAVDADVASISQALSRA